MSFNGESLFNVEFFQISLGNLHRRTALHITTLPEGSHFCSVAPGCSLTVQRDDRLFT